jgi:hypothetical protein
MLTITNEDRTQTLFNYCSPIAKQISNAVVSQSKYVFLTLSSKTSNYLTVNFYYYLMDPTTAVSSTPQITTTSSFSCMMNQNFKFILKFNLLSSLR